MKNKITKLGFVLLLISGMTYAQEKRLSEEAMPDYVRKATNIEFLNDFAERKYQEFEKRYQKAVEIAEEKGMLIGGSDNGSAFSLINYEDTTGALMYYSTSNNSENASSLQTANAKVLHTDGIIGTGLNIGVWDGGVLTINHLGFMTAGVNRYIVKDNGNNFPGNNQDGREHGPHVAGTVGAGNFGTGVAKGFAYGAKIFAYNWIQDLSEMASAAASTNAPIYTSNHSYGLYTSNWFASGGSVNIFGLYNSDSRDYDLIANNAPYYTIVFAAGNDREDNYNPSKNGKDLLSQAGVSKNVVVVAATKGTEDFSGITGSPSVSGSNPFIASFSNYGPTNDYRIKPDIAAKGVAVTSIGIEGNTSTRLMQGTSMAAPAVTGVFSLWQNYFKDKFGVYMKSASIRALMAHTAKEAGPALGPDFMFGWGLIDAGKGKAVIDSAVENKAVFNEFNLPANSVFEYEFNYDGIGELVITLAWNDPAGTADAIESGDINLKKLINDLDIVLTKDDGTIYYPWSLTKSWSVAPTSSNIAVRNVRNDRDNIEKIELPTKIAGNYKVTINHTGVLQGASQDFSLIISGAGGFMEQPDGGNVSAEEFALDNLKIYPNPASSILNISGNLEVLENADMKIFDVTGKEIVKSFLNGHSNNASIDVSFLKEGVYIISIKKDRAYKNYKFIKK